MMAESKTALIVGASRGLGLGLAQEYARRGWPVVATERGRSDELHRAAEASGGAIRLETVDVADDAQNRALAERLAGETFDLLFLNAGVTGAMDVMAADKAEVEAIMHANAFGPYKLAQLLIDRVRPGTAWWPSCPAAWGQWARTAPAAGTSTAPARPRRTCWRAACR
jgi:NAD(P)-dependent dehydrogenase (short-subunit alcohol dehydrogenase family)